MSAPSIYSNYATWVNNDEAAIKEAIYPSVGTRNAPVNVNLVTAALTDLIPAPTAIPPGCNCITTLVITNAHATVGTVVKVMDETSGFVLFQGYAAAGGGGFSIDFSKMPLKQQTQGKKVQVQCVTAGADVYVFANSFVEPI
jgi:hypothetical protein